MDSGRLSWLASCWNGSEASVPQGPFQREPWSPQHSTRGLGLGLVKSAGGHGDGMFGSWFSLGGLAGLMAELQHMGTGHPSKATL